MVGKCMLGLMVHVGRMQERLGRDASNVEAGATEGAALLDASGLETELSRLDGSDVAAGATSDDDVVVFVRSRGESSRPNERRERERVSKRLR